VHENYLLHCEYLNKQYAPPKSATNYHGHTTCVDLRFTENAARSWMRLASYLVSKSSGFRAQYTPGSLLDRPAMLRSSRRTSAEKEASDARKPALAVWNPDVAADAADNLSRCAQDACSREFPWERCVKALPPPSLTITEAAFEPLVLGEDGKGLSPFHGFHHAVVCGRGKLRNAADAALITK
jgi:hypothetical protein